MKCNRVETHRECIGDDVYKTLTDLQDAAPTKYGSLVDDFMVLRCAFCADLPEVEEE